MFNPQYDWLSCKLRTIPIIDIYKSISEDCHLCQKFGSYLWKYLDTQFWACLCLLKTLAANIMTWMIYTLKENPVVEQNTLFSCPTLYMFYLEIINSEKLPRLPALPPATGCKAHFDPSHQPQKNSRMFAFAHLILICKAQPENSFCMQDADQFLRWRSKKPPTTCQTQCQT